MQEKYKICKYINMIVIHIKIKHISACFRLAQTTTKQLSKKDYIFFIIKLIHAKLIILKVFFFVKKAFMPNIKFNTSFTIKI